MAQQQVRLRASPPSAASFSRCLCSFAPLLLCSSAPLLLCSLLLAPCSLLLAPCSLLLAPCFFAHTRPIDRGEGERSRAPDRCALGRNPSGVTPAVGVLQARLPGRRGRKVRPAARGDRGGGRHPAAADNANTDGICIASGDAAGHPLDGGAASCANTAGYTSFNLDLNLRPTGSLMCRVPRPA